MSRRAALTLAGATVVALLAGIVAVTFRIEALRSAPEPKAEPTRTKPIVREVTRTITVHRTEREKAEGSGGVITVVRTAAPSTATAGGAGEEPSRDREGDGREGGGDEKREDDAAGDKFK